MVKPMNAFHAFDRPATVIGTIKSLLFCFYFHTSFQSVTLSPQSLKIFIFWAIVGLMWHAEFQTTLFMECKGLWRWRFNTQDYWGSGLCLSTVILKTRKQLFGNWVGFHPQIMGGRPTMLGPWERANLNHELQTVKESYENRFCNAEFRPSHGIPLHSHISFWRHPLAHYGRTYRHPRMSIGLLFSVCFLGKYRENVGGLLDVIQEAFRDLHYILMNRIYCLEWKSNSRLKCLVNHHSCSYPLAFHAAVSIGTEFTAFTEAVYRSYRTSCRIWHVPSTARVLLQLHATSVTSDKWTSNDAQGVIFWSKITLKAADIFCEVLYREDWLQRLFTCFVISVKCSYNCWYTGFQYSRGSLKELIIWEL
jgi:hypothetical protein